MLNSNNITLKPQDIVILLKIVSLEYKNWNTVVLSKGLFISQSEISESLRRSTIAHLYERESRIIYKNSLLDFIIYGLKYAFPAIIGPEARGIATAHSAPPISFCIKSNFNYVWPDSYGDIRGQSIKPLYGSVTKAVKIDKKLYELLALVDAIRIGKAREINIANMELKKRILNRI